MDNIYFLQHYYEKGDVEILTNIAVYSTRDKAESAMIKFKSHPKFFKHPEDFNIDKYKIDEDNWTEGFFTY